MSSVVSQPKNQSKWCLQLAISKILQLCLKSSLKFLIFDSMSTSALNFNFAVSDSDQNVKWLDYSEKWTENCMKESYPGLMQCISRHFPGVSGENYG
jgi:hypothetical protein